MAESLAIARQIVDALEAAHEQGIVHRDLKPANVKVRPAGTVKVLDFGLAKLVGGVAGSSEQDPAYAPTITTPAMTRAGVILGTAASMSPEQAKGRDADKRSDVWAFGCVLYEMLTRKRAFDGDDMTDVPGAVVRLEPDWTAVPANVPVPISFLPVSFDLYAMKRLLGERRGARICDSDRVTRRPACGLRRSAACTGCRPTDRWTRSSGSGRRATSRSARSAPPDGGRAAPPVRSRPKGADTGRTRRRANAT
jgi:serine/threonine protein kinase